MIKSQLRLKARANSHKSASSQVNTPENKPKQKKRPDDINDESRWVSEGGTN